MKNKGLILGIIIWVIFIFFSVAKCEEVKKYLKIGADPFWPNRPIPLHAKVFIIKEDVWVRCKGKNKIYEGWLAAGTKVVAVKQEKEKWKAKWIAECGNDILNDLFLIPTLEVSVVEPAPSAPPPAPTTVIVIEKQPQAMIPVPYYIPSVVRRSGWGPIFINNYRLSYPSYPSCPSCPSISPPVVRTRPPVSPPTVRTRPPVSPPTVRTRPPVSPPTVHARPPGVFTR